MQFHLCAKNYTACNFNDFLLFGIGRNKRKKFKYCEALVQYCIHFSCNC